MDVYTVKRLFPLNCLTHSVSHVIMIVFVFVIEKNYSVINYNRHATCEILRPFSPCNWKSVSRHIFLTPQLLATTFLLSVSMSSAYIFKILHVSVTMQYLSLWLISLSRFIHVVVNDRIPFFLKAE